MSATREPSRQLHGIIPPLVTPLRDRDTLDAEGLGRLIEHLIAGGVHGIFVLGSTGEIASLSDAVRAQVIIQTCRFVGGRVPVLVGITDTAVVRSLDLARRAAEAGADAVVLTTPYYYPMSPEDLSAYLHRVLAELPLPVMLYNIPQLTKVRIDPQTLERATQWDNVIGLKDSSNDRAYLDQVMAIARGRTDWSIFVGTETLLPDFIYQGGHGGVCGGANLAPKLFVEMYEAASRRDDSRVAGLRQRIAELGTIYRLGPSLPDSIRGQKHCLSIMGICSPGMAEPFAESRPVEASAIRDRLRAFGLLA